MEEDESRRLVWRYITRIGTCMMVTRTEAAVRARPMRGMARPEANVIWFFAERDGTAHHDLACSTSACLTYADLNEQTFVSVSGEISLVEDKDMIAELSNAATEAYFPGAPEDGSMLLLKFEPEFGEFWDAPSSPILLAIKFLQAKVSGERPNLGINGSARLTR